MYYYIIIIKCIGGFQAWISSYIVWMASLLLMYLFYTNEFILLLWAQLPSFNNDRGYYELEQLSCLVLTWEFISSCSAYLLFEALIDNSFILIAAEFPPLIMLLAFLKLGLCREKEEGLVGYGLEFSIFTMDSLS